MPLKRVASPPAQDLSAKAANKRLRIWIPTPLELASVPSPVDEGSISSRSSSTVDSLFDDVDDASDPEAILASLTAPHQIEGLFFDPTLLLSESLATSVFDYCQKTYFHSPGLNQVMLFGRFDSSSEAHGGASTTGFPPILCALLDTLADVLRPSLPPQTYDLLFPSRPTQSRQAIVNHYRPGEGITSHVDLLGRYGDGIIGVSFGSGCVMRFDEVVGPSTSPRTSSPVEKTQRYDLYLPERGVVVMSEDARYKWTHGIERRTVDWVRTSSRDTVGECRDRGTRISVTFRWMLDGADIVGES